MEGWEVVDLDVLAAAGESFGRLQSKRSGWDSLAGAFPKKQRQTSVKHLEARPDRGESGRNLDRVEGVKKDDQDDEDLLLVCV
jgi:hypothetical protein